MNTLIVFSTKHGCTEKCAKLLSNELKDKIDLVNLKTAKDIDISTYDKVIIGGSIYIGRIQKEVREFCLNNLEKLKEKKVALFICGMQEGDLINTEINENFPKELIESSIIKSHFGGEYNFDNMSFFEKLTVKIVAKASSSKSNILNDNIKSFAKTLNSI
mgnify:CR=1 FL=1